MDVLETFIPPDRRWSLALDAPLPDRASGAVLFADVSGFTPLTEAMTRLMGARRGAEELTKQLNIVYDALIAQIEKFGGSVITFAGDAALCWFAETDTPRETATRAVACALALQNAMRQFSALELPDHSATALAIKVTVAYGGVRRFAVGDPEIRRIDVLAGSTVARTSTAEHLAHPGEILVDETTAALDSRLKILDWRENAVTQERFAVVGALNAEIEPPSPRLTPPLSDELLRPWLHPAVYERLRAEGELFLTELRPVVAMFIRFHGIDFDADEAAGEKLDRFIARVQQILARYEGTLLELTIGDKGSYFYVAFGAPHMHEDDARRAVFATRELIPLCQELGYIEPLQIGISQGVMRVGGYGGATRRMYGAQGDEVNLAARLMEEAAPGTVLISGHVQKVVMNEFDLEPLAPIRLKGKTDPLLPFVVQGLRETRVQQLQEAYYALPMIGREQELALVQEKLEHARRGQGQIVGITARAGMGKSRLTAEVIRAVRRQRESSYGGECQSFGSNISYLVWAPVWRAFFGMDENLPLRRQLRALESAVQDLASKRMDALPLLGPVLNLAIPENDFTRGLEPEFRKSALYALLLDCVRAAGEDARGEGHALLFVIEDAHWIDPASRDLLEELAVHIADLPVLILLNYRPPESETENLPGIKALPNFIQVELKELSGAQGEGLIRAKIAQHAPDSSAGVPNELIGRLLAQAQGNPFYIEQLLDYIHDRGINFRDPIDFAGLELPNTLHRLILSRLDQLNERQQLTLKAASIIGRWFTLAHLCGYFPAVGSPAQVQVDLALLQNYDLTTLDQPEPELAYLFKHLITHQVAYESLPYATRSMLHEAYAKFLETYDDPARSLDLIAYHYDRSENLLKRQVYLRRAGEAAAERFANEEAVNYLTRALAIAPPNALEERFALLTAREHVFDVQGAREQQHADLAELAQIAEALNDTPKKMRVLVQQGWLAERITDHATANEIVHQVNGLLSAEQEDETVTEAHMENSLLAGVILWQQGNPNSAKPYFEKALTLARALKHPVGQGRALSFLGTVYREGGAYAQAQAYYLEQLPLAREIRDVRREWSALNNLGLIANARGNFQEALDYYSEALRIVREIGDRLGEGLVLSNLALTAMDRGEYDRALEYSEQALQVATIIADHRSVCRILLNLGETHRLSGQYVSAREHLQNALTMARGMGDQQYENFALMNLAALAHDENELARARELVGQGLPIARAIGHRDGESFLLNTLGQVQWAEGKADAAHATFESALAIWNTLEPMVYALDAHAGLAEIALKQDDLESAQAHVETILAYLDAQPAQRGAPPALNAALTAYHVLQRIDAARAKELLAATQAALQDRANKIGDETLRRSFLGNVRLNHAILEAMVGFC